MVREHFSLRSWVNSIKQRKIKKKLRNNTESEREHEDKHACSFWLNFHANIDSVCLFNTKIQILHRQRLIFQPVRNFNTYSSLSSIYTARLDFHMEAWSNAGTDGKMTLMRLMTPKKYTVLSQKVQMLTFQCRKKYSLHTLPRFVFSCITKRKKKPSTHLVAGKRMINLLQFLLYVNCSCLRYLTFTLKTWFRSQP